MFFALKSTTAAIFLLILCVLPPSTAKNRWKSKKNPIGTTVSSTTVKQESSASTTFGASSTTSSSSVSSTTFGVSSSTTSDTTTSVSSSTTTGSGTSTSSTKSPSTQSTPSVRGSSLTTGVTNPKLSVTTITAFAGETATETVDTRTKTTSPSDTTTSDLGGSSVGCQSNDWINMDGMCYLFTVTHTLSFHEAESYCQKYRARLASVHSSTTNYKISKFMWLGIHTEKVHPSAYWIGLTLKPLKNIIVPKWTDNSTIDYSDYILPPVATSSVETCTEIQYMGNEWRQADCTNTNHFVCARPAGKEKPPTKSTQSKSTPKSCVCSGCITCYVFIAILGLTILFITRKCFWSLMKTGRFSGKPEYAYKAVMKDLSKDMDDETDDDF